jgi:hypothetical protein
MRSTFEKVLASKRFSMPTLITALEPHLAADVELAKALAELKKSVSPKVYVQLIRGIVRHVFLIELVKKPKIETTRVVVRWTGELDGDPRGSSFDECLLIARDLVAELVGGWLRNTAHIEELELFLNHRLLSYELPIDYATVDTKSLHRRKNVILAADPMTVRTLELRALLTGESHKHGKLMQKALDDKIKIKTYLTDRVLTGEHKTNREKRWETHPESVHFATRRACLGIEYKLVTQLCGFTGFPADVLKVLQKKGVVPARVPVYRCPVTMDAMQFDEFAHELQNPKIGKSRFQVGHLNPLKLALHTDADVGHNADNIGWVSQDGNRIQGHLSLDATRELLARIAKNYADHGMV